VEEITKPLHVEEGRVLAVLCEIYLLERRAERSILEFRRGDF